MPQGDDVFNSSVRIDATPLSHAFRPISNLCQSEGISAALVVVFLYEIEGIYNSSSNYLALHFFPGRQAASLFLNSIFSLRIDGTFSMSWPHTKPCACGLLINEACVTRNWPKSELFIYLSQTYPTVEQFGPIRLLLLISLLFNTWIGL